MKKKIKYWLQTAILFIVIATVFLIVYLYTQSGDHLYNISNYAIAISLGFSSVCFSWARAEDDLEARKLILMAGRNFFKSIFFLIIASIFDYASFNLIKAKIVEAKNDPIWLGYFIFFSIGVVLFGLAFDNALAGLRKAEPREKKKEGVLPDKKA